jgi:pimeloyl-ACP methyl ester carboxylesterase
MTRFRLLIVALAAALGTVTGSVPPTGASVAEESVDSAAIRTDDVCFTVHNEGDPLPSRVYGVRYYRTEPGPRTPVIILVHGNSVTHSFWDVRPDLDFSVTRRLAEAGYLVVAYDRLGYGNSPYRRPHGAGYTLSISSQRSMLHEIVGQVKAGNYSYATTGGCSGGTGRVVGLSSPGVVIIGHSGGGGVVSGPEAPR